MVTEEPGISWGTEYDDRPAWQVDPNGEPPPDPEYPQPPDDYSDESTVVLGPQDADDSLLRSRMIRGGDFILDHPADPQPLWGNHSSVLWAEGEALTIVGGQGVGKTTLAQQLALARCGFPEYADLLGFPITPNTSGTTLYLAMDRPRQAARSFRRMVGEAWRAELNRTLLVWEGPPLIDVARDPRSLLGYAQAADAETVVVDSIKDAALKLSDDEVGGAWNRARQLVLADGRQLVELHHHRKAQAGGKPVRSLDDVYGSTWITVGTGSVLVLDGDPGDPIVALRHLKQPADEVGPFKVHHDQDGGRSTVWQSVDLALVCKARPGGLSAIEAARMLFDVDTPTPALRERARRRLDLLAKDGSLTILDPGDPAANRPKRWG